MTLSRTGEPSTQTPIKITPELLEAMTDCDDGDAEIWAPLLTRAAARYDISTPARMAAWVGQIAHESQRFRHTVENLNYSAARLRQVFPRHFPDSRIAGAYAHAPERIANRVYAHRLGNGDEASGDGWRFRGRGLIQITGRDNYRACGAGIYLNVITHPDILTIPLRAATSAAWYWHVRKLNALADNSDYELITRRVNGGLNGLQDRVNLSMRALRALA